MQIKLIKDRYIHKTQTMTQKACCKLNLEVLKRKDVLMCLFKRADSNVWIAVVKRYCTVPEKDARSQ